MSLVLILTFNYKPFLPSIAAILCLWHLNIEHYYPPRCSARNLGPYWDFYLPEPNTQTLSQEEGTSGSGCHLCMTFLLVEMLEPAFIKRFFWSFVLSLWCCANLNKALLGDTTVTEPGNLALCSLYKSESVSHSVVWPFVTPMLM